jgi:hypothetical protein
MRAFLVLTVLIGASWAIDTLAFNGQYTEAAWQEAKDRGAQFNSEIVSLLEKFGADRLIKNLPRFPL